MTYRPDLNGIEYFWSDMKQLYRKRVKDAKVNNKKFDQFKLVSDCFAKVRKRRAQRACYQGLMNILNCPEPELQDAHLELENKLKL